MEDRIPTPGQEGRVKITPESGNPFYAKLEMADNPLQAGTPLDKSSLLKDVTCDVLGISREATVNDALLKLAIGPGKYGFALTVLTPGGRPVRSVKITGATKPNGEIAYTDGNGYALLSSPTANPSITLETGYHDLVPSKVIVLTATGTLTYATVRMDRKEPAAETMTTSGMLWFTNDVNTITYGIVGAGGGGGGGAYARQPSEDGYSTGTAGGGGGGSGYHETGNFINTSSLPVNMAIGAGGAGGNGAYYTTYSSGGYTSAQGGAGGAGGATTISQGDTLLSTGNGGGGGGGGYANTFYGSSRPGTGGIGQVNGGDARSTADPSQCGGPGGDLGSSYGTFGRGGNGGNVIATSVETAAQNNGAPGGSGICWLTWNFREAVQ